MTLQYLKKSGSEIELAVFTVNIPYRYFKYTLGRRKGKKFELEGEAKSHYINRNKRAPQGQGMETDDDADDDENDDGGDDTT
jgi:hypothetical protein